MSIQGTSRKDLQDPVPVSSGHYLKCSEIVQLFPILGSSQFFSWGRNFAKVPYWEVAKEECSGTKLCLGPTSSSTRTKVLLLCRSSSFLDFLVWHSQLKLGKDQVCTSRETMPGTYGDYSQRLNLDSPIVQYCSAQYLLHTAVFKQVQ